MASCTVTLAYSVSPPPAVAVAVSSAYVLMIFPPVLVVTLTSYTDIPLPSVVFGLVACPVLV